MKPQTTAPGKSPLAAYRDTITMYFGVMQKIAADERLEGTPQRHSEIAACAARIAAAGKAARAAWIIQQLRGRPAALADLTPTLALHVVSAIIGRGISNRSLNKAFGRRGRTADAKTELQVSDFDEFIEETRPKFAEFKSKLEEIRDQVKALSST